jgi:SAM-dependent methyltransferase
MGIDTLDEGDRALVLSEVGRVLKPGGVFVFSSHNFDRELLRPFTLRRLAFEGDPIITIVRNSKRLLAYFANLPILIKRAVFRTPYAILCEDEELTGMILRIFYIGKEEQTRQLLGAGFVSVTAYGMDGQQIYQEKSMVDPWIEYVARKATAKSPRPQPDGEKQK